MALFIPIRFIPGTAPNPPGAQPNKTVNSAQAPGNWTPPGRTAVAFNYQSFALAKASHVPGDWFECYGGNSVISPRIYAEQLNFKGAVNGTGTKPILYTMAVNNWIRLKFALTKQSTAYTAASADAGQGLIHFEGNSWIILDMRDSTGTAQALEVGDPTQWTPGPNPFSYSHYQSLTYVTSSHITLKGVWVHGSNQYECGYAGTDCTDNYFYYVWFDKHGTNYGYVNGQGVTEAAGNMFDYCGTFSVFDHCKNTFCGHNTGPAILGHHNVVRNGDHSGDWRSVQASTGKPYTYNGNIYPGNLTLLIPSPAIPYAANTQCGPVLVELNRYEYSGPSELSGAPYSACVAWNPIIRRNIYADQVAGGHNVFICNVASIAPTTAIATPLVGAMQFYNNSIYGCAGLYDATDSGTGTNAMSPNNYSQDRFFNNVIDQVTDSGSPGPYFIRHFQNTPNCGTNSFPDINRGCQFYGNIINGPAPSGAKDASNLVYSRTLYFGAYNGTKAVDKFCDILDNGVAFPNDVYGNSYLTSIPWVNVAARSSSDLPTAHAGMQLSPGASIGIGDALPATTVTASGTNISGVHVKNARWAYDGWGIGGACPTEVPDYIAFIAAGGGNVRIRQLTPFGTNSGADFTNSILYVSSPVTVLNGDSVYPVLPDGVTVMLNRGLM